MNDATGAIVPATGVGLVPTSGVPTDFLFIGDVSRSMVFHRAELQRMLGELADVLPQTLRCNVGLFSANWRLEFPEGMNPQLMKTIVPQTSPGTALFTTLYELFQIYERLLDLDPTRVLLVVVFTDGEDSKSRPGDDDRAQAKVEKLQALRNADGKARFNLFYAGLGDGQLHLPQAKRTGTEPACTVTSAEMPQLRANLTQVITDFLSKSR